MALKLVQEGHTQEKVFAGGTVWFGSDPTCHVVLSNMKGGEECVSQAHAEATLQGRVWHLEDRSTNGTWMMRRGRRWKLVAGEDGIALEPQDRVLFSKDGPVVLILEATDTAPAPGLPWVEPTQEQEVVGPTLLHPRPASAAATRTRQQEAARPTIPWDAQPEQPHGDTKPSAPATPRSSVASLGPTVGPSPSSSADSTRDPIGLQIRGNHIALASFITAILSAILGVIVTIAVHKQWISGAEQPAPPPSSSAPVTTAQLSSAPTTSAPPPPSHTSTRPPGSCDEPWVTLVAVGDPLLPGFDWDLSRQILLANPTFTVVASAPRAPGEIQVAAYSLGTSGAHALAARCADLATCNQLAATYHRNAPSQRPAPVVSCGAPKTLHGPSSHPFTWSTAPGGNLPIGGNTQADCGRLSACYAALHPASERDVFLDCQRAPSTFPLRCAPLATCSEVEGCATR